MDIREFIKSYPGVSVAEEADNADILEFFSKTHIQGKGMDIFYDRGPDFFTFLKMHARNYLVMLYRNEYGLLQGVATLLFRKGYVNGQIQDICYLGDLRLGFTRRGAVTWRKTYGDFFKYKDKIDQLKNIKLFYTCVIESNEASKKNLILNNKAEFLYNRVCPYSMVTLMFKKPSFRRKSLEFVTTNSTKLESILDFYSENERHIPAGYLYSQEIPERLEKWADFNKNNFLVVKRGEQILASCALWSPRHSKRILLKKIPLYLRSFFKLLRLTSFGKFQFQGELKVLYLTHLQFDSKLSPAEKSEIFHELLCRAWELKGEKGYHFLSFCDFQEASLKNATKDFICNEIRMEIHEVTRRDEPTSLTQKHYGFEMALV